MSSGSRCRAAPSPWRQRPSRQARGDEPGKPDDVAVLFDRGDNDSARRDHDAEVDHLVAVAAEDDADDVLADVVDVTLDRREDDGGSVRSASSCRPHVRLEVGDGALHGARALHDLREERLPRPEEVADDLHAVHQRPLDHVERPRRGCWRASSVSSSMKSTTPWIADFRCEHGERLPSMSGGRAWRKYGSRPGSLRRGQNQSVRDFSSTRSSCVTLPDAFVICVLQLPSGEIVEVQLPPVVALGEPDQLVRSRAARASSLAPLPDSILRRTDSANTARIAPVATSAMRNRPCLWSRDVETNARCRPSGYHSTSVQVGHRGRRCRRRACSDARRAGIWKRVHLRGARRRSSTRWIVVTMLSPGIG